MEFILCAVAVLLCKVQGSSAVTPVFVKTGDDVLLKVMKTDEFGNFVFFSWKYNARNILVSLTPNNDPQISPNYTERIEFFEENYSVKLKSLQHTDSGVYTARVTKISEELTVAEYKVTVQDPVSSVNLTVNSVSNSSNSCNVTVTCRTQDSHINSTFRCDTQTCSQDGGEQSKVTTSGASLQVYLDVNDSFVCNHSNQVSWTKDIKTITDLCPRHSDFKPLHQHIAGTVTAVVVPLIFIFIVFFIVVAAVLHLRKRRKNNRDSMENTVYEVPQIATTAQPPDKRQKRDVSELSPTSTYCLVGPHTGSVGSTEIGSTPLPESLYAQVEKPAKTSKN